MQKLIMIFALITILFQTAFCQEAKLDIAVNDLTGKGIDKSTAGIISDRLRSELIKTGVFRVMERNEMENVLKEQGFQNTGACVESSCLIEAGQLLGVDRMVAGSIGKIGDFYTISLRIISVTTSEIIFTVNEDYKGKIEKLISTVIGNAAKKLAIGAGGELEKAAKAGRKGDLYIDTDLEEAVLEVLTDPENCSVFINGKVVGVTPYTNKRMTPGNYMLKIAKETYNPIKRDITIIKDSTIVYEFTLKHNKTYLNSGAKAKKTKKRKMQWVRRIVFGTLAAGCGAGGIVMNLKSNDAYDTYMADNNQLSTNHESLYDDVENYETIRNVLYGIAGGFTLGFVISIPF